MKGKPGVEVHENEVPAPKSDIGMRETDDHVMGGTPRGATQPIDDLDPGIDAEHLNSPSQGVRPDR